MWKHCCAFVCAVLALLYNTSASVRTVSDPSTLPLLQFADLKYTGAFRLPAGKSNGDSFSIGGHPIAYNPARNSLFIGSLQGNVAEVSIPTAVNSANVESLPFASYLQGFYEPTEGHLGAVDSVDATVDSILVYGNRLYGTGSIFYDAQNTQRVSHFSRALQLNQLTFTGWSSLWDLDKQGFVSGFMGLVPAEWQAKLGGPAITGQCCIPIAWRTSWGPSAFAFNPMHIGQGEVDATPLLYYPSDHHTLGPWSGSNPTYGATTQVKGVAIIAGTRSILYFGRNGLGPYCYGNGTNNQSLHNTMADNGALWCYDPTSTDKGQHAYPYRYQIWAYDLNELAKVKAGQKKPWEVTPYGVWPFELPTPEPGVKIGGIGYDSATQTIYLSQMRADKDVYSNRPIIHVLKVGGVAGSPLPSPSGDYEPPPVNTDPPPATGGGSAKVTAVTITPSKSAPQAPGTTINLTATPAGGQAPHQYKWQLHDGSKWSAITSWSTSNAYAWTPSKANSAYKLSVWVRSAGNTADAAEVTTNLNFPISGTPSTSTPTAPRVSSVGIAANRVAPQAPSTSVTFTALPSGGASPLQYKWSVSNGSSWSTAVNWTTSSTFTWTPSSANSGYEVRVWVRSSGNSADAAEAQAAMDFPIVASSTPAPTTPPPTTSAPPPSQTTKITSVGIAASKAAPQPPGTAIVMTATPLGGAAHQYKWLLHDGSGWTPITGWSTSNNYTWTPAAANGSYKLSVWVRNGGVTADAAEASTNLSFPISATAPPSTSTPPTTQPLTSSVTIASNKAAPQNRGTSVTWTATPSGGKGPHQYKFYVWDSAAWVVMRGWSTSNTFTWTPNLANPYYKVMVWVRSAGNTSDNYEAQTTSGVFQIK